MLTLDPGDRLALGLTIDDCLSLAQQAESINHNFLSLCPARQIILLARAYLRSQPCQAATADNPRAVNWERVLQFFESLLPLLLELLMFLKSRENPAPPLAGT